MFRKRRSMLPQRSGAAYLPSSPPRAVYIPCRRPRPRRCASRTQRGREPIAAMAESLPPATSFPPTSAVCGQCLTVNCANSAELRRGQGFGRWPIAVGRGVGSAAATKLQAANQAYTNKSKRDICISTPSYAATAAHSPRGPRCLATREHTAPMGGECPLLPLFHPLPLLFDPIVQPSKSIPYRSFLSSSLSSLFLTLF